MDSPCLNLRETRTLGPSFLGVGRKGKAEKAVTPGAGAWLNNYGRGNEPGRRSSFDPAPAQTAPRHSS